MNKSDKIISNPTEILLHETSTQEVKYCYANDMINYYDLPLSCEQILNAHEKINKQAGLYKIFTFKHLYVFLLDTTLNINKNMYIAIILALNNNEKATIRNLHSLVDFNKKSIGINTNRKFLVTSAYFNLLDHYDFDTSDLDMDYSTKMQVKYYRDSKYSGKMTKAARI